MGKNTNRMGPKLRGEIHNWCVIMGPFSSMWNLGCWLSDGIKWPGCQSPKTALIFINHNYYQIHFVLEFKSIDIKALQFVEIPTYIYQEASIFQLVNVNQQHFSISRRWQTALFQPVNSQHPKLLHFLSHPLNIPICPQSWQFSLLSQRILFIWRHNCETYLQYKHGVCQNFALVKIWFRSNFFVAKLFGSKFLAPKNLL